MKDVIEGFCWLLLISMAFIMYHGEPDVIDAIIDFIVRMLK